MSETTVTTPKVIVIGAGMAGLSAAWRLSQLGVDVIVYEKSARVGGRVFTDTVNGATVEAGAQFIANFYDNTLRMIRDLGIEDEVIPITGHGGIVRDRHLFELWYDGRSAFSSLIGLSSKTKFARVLPQLIANWSDLDIHAFNRAYKIDTASLAEFSLRHLDEDILEYLLQPLLSGIFYWTPETTSQAMLFVLLKASIGGIGIRLLTLRGGLGRLPNEVAKHLKVELNAAVTEVRSDGSGQYVCVVETNNAKHEQFADGIVCSVPAVDIPALPSDVEDHERNFLGHVSYSSTVGMQIGISHRLPQAVYGVFFPRRESHIRYLAAATFQSAKNPMLSPPDRDVVGLFSSDLASSQLRSRGHEFVHSALLTDLSQLGPSYSLDNSQLFHKVYDWTPAVPHFDVGYFQRLNAFKQRQIGPRRVVFAGDYIGGPFIEGAVTSGLDAADQLIQQLKNS